jgi:uncharacterized transporter YbjL
MGIKDIAKGQVDYGKQQLLGIVKNVNYENENYTEIITSYDIILRNGDIIYTVQNSSGIEFAEGSGVIISRLNRLEFEIIQQSQISMTIEDIENIPDPLILDTGMLLDDNNIVKR